MASSRYLKTLLNYKEFYKENYKEAEYKEELSDSYFKQAKENSWSLGACSQNSMLGK